MQEALVITVDMNKKKLHVIKLVGFPEGSGGTAINALGSFQGDMKGIKSTKS